MKKHQYSLCVCVCPLTFKSYYCMDKQKHLTHLKDYWGGGIIPLTDDAIVFSSDGEGFGFRVVLCCRRGRWSCWFPWRLVNDQHRTTPRGAAEVI